MSWHVDAVQAAKECEKLAAALGEQSPDLAAARALCGSLSQRLSGLVSSAALDVSRPKDTPLTNQLESDESMRYSPPDED